MLHMNDGRKFIHFCLNKFQRLENLHFSVGILINSKYIIMITH